MQHRVPHSKRFWRLEQELREDGLVSESEEDEVQSVSETDWETDTEGETDEYETESDFDDEEDWYQENLHLGSLPV